MSKIQRAILSVTDKSGLVDFARKLAELGVELVSTGGTAKLLRDSGIAVKDISELTGFPEMLDGRVKTLHPKVHGGILHRREDSGHRAAVAEHGIPAIDMVVVNLYAFEKTAAKPGVHFEELIENIDIGGPSMIRSAAKNFQDVAVVTSPADYGAIAEEMARSGGTLVSRETKWRLAQKAFATTAAYDSAIASTLERVGGNCELHPFELKPAEGFPQNLRLSFQKVMDLRYGENPHQKAAMYADGSGAGVANARQLQGKELSYNNIVDLQAAWDLAQEFDEPVCAIIKHTNPCGTATGKTLAEAYVRALECDPVSAFGGVIGVNRTVDAAAASEMAKLFLEVIAAPAFDEGAKAAFASKKNLRLVEVPAGQQNWVLKNISGGMLVQDADLHKLAEGRSESGYQAGADAGRKTGAAVRVEGLQAREVERHSLRPRWANGGRRRRTNEPRRFLQAGRDEGAVAAEGYGGRLRCLFSLPGRRRGNRQSGGHRDHPARRLGARPGGHRSCRPAWVGYDLHRGAAFQALSASGLLVSRCPGQAGRARTPVPLKPLYLRLLAPPALSPRRKARRG